MLALRSSAARALWASAVSLAFVASPALAAPRSAAQPQVPAQAGSSLHICPQDVCVTRSSSCEFELPILISGTATLDAVGFDIQCSGTTVVCWGIRPGPVLRGWETVETRTLAGNRVRIGGYDDGAFALNGTDTLVVVRFWASISPGDASFTAEEFVDDLAGATGCTATATWRQPLPSPNGQISIAAAGDSTPCCFETPDGTLLNVMAHLAGASAGGIRGTAFRIEVAPPAPGAVLAWTPAPLAGTFVGNPVDNTSAPGDRSGATLTFSECVTPPGGEFLLGTLLVSGLSGERELRVRRHNVPPSGVDCPFFVLCDACPREYACLAPSSAGDPIVYSARINTASCRRPLAPPNGYVLVAPESEPTSCCYPTPEGATLAVFAEPEGGTLEGIRGASFRIEISPPAPGAIFDWTPAPGIVSSVGDPVDNSSSATDSSGITLAFPSCVPPVDHRVLLGRITVHGLTEPRELLVRRHNASPANAPCPYFSRCAPCPDDRACMTPAEGGDPYIFRAYVNYPSCEMPCGPVGVTPTTWGDVKKLYR